MGLRARIRDKLAGIAGLAALVACSPLPAAVVTIAIRPEVGGQSLILDSQQYVSATGEKFAVGRLSYLVSGVALQHKEGRWEAVPNAVAWLDARNGREEFVLENLPSGAYQKLRFQIGLDATTNAADTAQYAPGHPLNPNLNGLQWPMLGGFIFLALEGKFSADGGELSGYAYHLAREPFRTVVELPIALDLGKAARVELRFDLAKVFGRVTKISFAKDGSTTHSKDGDPVAIALKGNIASALEVVSSVASPVAGSVTSQSTSLSASTELLRFAKTFPRPALPEDNPLTPDRVALGRALFNETALSRDGSVSCASCHQAAAAFSDSRQFSAGVEGRKGDRNAMPLFNLAWKREFFWDGRAPSLRAQALMPIEDHREMDENLENVVKKLSAKEGYLEAFTKAFGSGGVSSERIGLALENFMLTLTSYDSKYDRYLRGEATFTPDEQRGMELFFMEREPRLGTMGADCFHCHGGALFTDHQFRNNGLAIDEADTGRHRVTGVGIDKGTFATPSLRNVALTAPYMHDGRFTTLEEVVDHYSTGVKRTISLDSNLAKHPEGGLAFTDEDKRSLVAFLKTLTDVQFTQQATRGGKP